MENLSDVFKNVFDSDGTPAAVAGLIGVLPDHPATKAFVPVAHQDYVFSKGLLLSLLTWWQRPRNSSMLLTGPTGSGKTSIVTEIAARLNWPVFSVTCHERTEFSALRGQWLLQTVAGATQPEMRFQEGPLIQAMRLGGVLILNELDIAPAGEMSALNDIIEGRPLVVPELGGQIIKPHPNFRVVATANTKGSGDESGLYQGAQMQNVAAMDRYRCLVVPYLKKEVELQIVKAVWMQGGIIDAEAHEMARRQCEFAEQIRNAFIGTKGCDGTLSVPLSTRNLVHWTELALDYKGCTTALSRALDEVLLNRASEADAIAIRQMAIAKFSARVWEGEPQKKKEKKEEKE